MTETSQGCSLNCRTMASSRFLAVVLGGTFMAQVTRVHPSQSRSSRSISKEVGTIRWSSSGRSDGSPTRATLVAAGRDMVGGGGGGG